MTARKPKQLWCEIHHKPIPYGIGYCLYCDNERSLAERDALIKGTPCSECKTPYIMHAGSNVCPKCGERTFLPAPEVNSK